MLIKGASGRYRMCVKDSMFEYKYNEWVYHITEL